MFYYLYEIKNLVNNKVYVGVHKTSNLDDGYMGSGTVIKDAIEKYGKENFEKKILEFFPDSKTMFDREKEIVTEDFLNRDDVYNIRRGGTGGFDFINQNKLNIQSGPRPKSFSEKQSLRIQQQVKDGVHPWQGEAGSKRTRELQLKRVAEGTHPFKDSEKQRELCMRQIHAGTHAFLGGDLQRKRIAEGTHHFAGEQGSLLSKRNNENMLKNGKHPSQIMKTCEHCSKEVSSPNYKRWHGINCKHKK